MSRPLSPMPLQRKWQPQPNRTHGVRDLMLGIALVAMILMTSACGGGGGSSAAPAVTTTPPPAVTTGELLLGLTDAEGDFITYSVSVDSLTLERANGDVVETLPLQTVVDFTELTEVTEFLSVATVPEGIYQTVTLSLDYSDAEIFVEDAAGAAVQASPVDAEGNPVTDLEVRLELTTSDVIRIQAGIPAAFSLDFDLEASNTVDLTGVEPLVVVDAFLLATPELETDREHRVRGVTDSVDVASNEISLKVRPFRHRTGQFGEFTLTVDEATQYEIEGQGFTGADGLDAMALLAENSPVVANGSIDGSGMMADIVIAGSSVPWTDGDVLKGVVTARSADVLTVAGASIEFADGTRRFRDIFTVNLLADTSVSAPGIDNEDLSIQSVSVGQRVIVWGEFVDDVTLDATRVRMLMNSLSGTVASANPLAVDLFKLNGRDTERFDFSGTGMTSQEDADPDFYEIDTGALGLDGLVDDATVRVRGIVNEFGAAPADFNARTVIDIELDSRAALFTAKWDEPTNVPFSAIDAARIDVDLSAARKLLKLRGIPSNLAENLETIGLMAPEEGRGVYAVKVRGAGEVHVFREFADLVDELVAQLDAGNELAHLSSQGSFDAENDAMIVRRGGFTFVEPAAAE